MDQITQLREILEKESVDFELFSHAEIIVSAEDGVKNGMGSLAEMAPTLILQTEKGYLAAIIPGDRRLVYKKIKQKLGLKNVSMAGAEVVLQITGSQIGSVSLVNPGIPTLMDRHLCDRTVVYGGCGIPQYTLRIAPDDLARITHARIFDFTEPKQSEPVA